MDYDYENEDLIEMITIGDETDNDSIVSDLSIQKSIHFQSSPILNKKTQETQENDTLNEIEFLKETVFQLKEEEEKKTEDKINNTRIIRGLFAITIISVLGYIFFRAIFYDTTRTTIAFLIYTFSAIGLYIYDQNIYPILDSVYGKDALINLGKIGFEEGHVYEE